MEAVLEATARETIGKNEARRTRRGGQVPAVLYGSAGDDGNKDPRAIAVDPKALLKILHSESGANTLISLKLAGEGNSRVLVKAYQLDPITHHVLHADFYRVAMDRKLTVTVPIHVKGEAKGVKQQGGVLDFVTREVEVECLPADIPENIEIDVTELVMNQGIRLRDVASGQKWTPISEPDTMLVHVVAIKVEEAPVADAAAVAAPATPAEPEVIKKGKVEKDEAKS
jgi:large subunit ribosomal protein L25